MKRYLIIALLFVSHMTWATVRNYNYSKEIKASGRWSMKADGIPVLVMDNPIPSSFAVFEMQGSVAIELENSYDIKWVDVRPLSAGIKPEIKNGKISFTINKPGNYTVEINGKLAHPLFIFANPVEQKPSKNDPNVIYFESGKIHNPGVITPKSGQHIYIEGGAVVVGAITATGVEKVKVSGYGIMDGTYNNGLSNEETASMFSVGNEHKAAGKYQRFVEFIDSKDISIEGIILNNSTTWQIVPINCDRVNISHVKIISDNPSDDGIDIVRSRKVHVSECFVRAKDDCVAIKAHLNYPETVIVDDVLVEKCVFWNAAWGNGLEIGFELQCKEVKNIIFRDCDIIHVESGAVFSIHNSEKATVKNVTFENIRIEDASQKLVDLAIFRSRYCTDGSSDQEYINKYYLNGAWDGVLMVPEQDRAYHAAFRGKIENVQFKDIYLYGTVPFSIIAGFDDQHDIKGVTFNNIYLNGQKVKKLDELKIFVEYAKDISLK